MHSGLKAEEHSDRAAGGGRKGRGQAEAGDEVRSADCRRWRVTLAESVAQCFALAHRHKLESGYPGTASADSGEPA